MATHQPRRDMDSVPTASQGICNRLCRSSQETIALALVAPFPRTPPNGSYPSQYNPMALNPPETTFLLLIWSGVSQSLEAYDLASRGTELR